jgi:hypothetical protein
MSTRNYVPQALPTGSHNELGKTGVHTNMQPSGKSITVKTGLADVMAMATLSGLTNGLDLEIANPNIDQLCEWWNDIYIHLTNIITQGRRVVDSNALQTYRLVLSEMTDIMDVNFIDKVVFNTVIPSGPAQDNVYAPSFATYSEERHYKNSSRQSSGIIPGKYKSLYTNVHQTYKTLETTMGDKPVYRQEVEKQVTEIGQDFVADMTRMIAIHCAYAEKALQAGFLELLHEINSQNCIPQPTMSIMKTYGTDFSIDAANQLVRKESLQLKVADNMRYRQLLEEYIKLDNKDAFLLSRDPQLCKRKLIAAFKELGEPDEFDRDNNSDDPRYTAKVTDSSGVDHTVMGHMFISEHAMNTFDKELGVEVGKIKDKRPVYVLPVKALKNVPDKGLLKTMVLGEQSGAQPDTVKTLKNDKGLMVEDNENPELVTTIKMEVAGTILELTERGRKVFQPNSASENAAAASGSYSNGREEPLGHWTISRNTKFIRDTDGDVYTIEPVKISEGKANAMTQRRNLLTNVTMGAFNRDFCHETWINSLLGSKFTKYVPAEKFQCPDVVTYTPSIKAQEITFTTRELMTACLDRDLHVPTDLIKAANNTLATARALADDDESQELRDHIVELQEIADTWETIYADYYNNRGGEIGGDGVSHRGDTSCENAKLQLFTAEIGPLLRLATIDHIDLLTGNMVKVLKAEKRKIIHEIPSIVMDMKQRKARGAQLLTHLASNTEQLQEADKCFFKAQCYLDNLLPGDADGLGGNSNDLFYFDVVPGDNSSPYLPRKNNNAPLTTGCSITEDMYVEAVHKLLQHMTSAMKNLYKTANGADEAGLKGVNYLFDTDNVKFRVFLLALIPVLMQGRMRLIVNNKHDIGDGQETNGPMGAVVTATAESAMEGFLNYGGAITEDNANKINFQGADANHNVKLDRAAYPLSLVSSGNVMDLCVSGTNALLRLFTTVMGYDYTSPKAMHRQVQNKVFPPFHVHFFCKYSVPCDNIMLMKPEGMTAIQNGTKVTTNSTNVNGDTKFHLTVGVKSSPNHRIAPGVIMKGVHQNPKLENNSITSQKTPIINLDHYNKSAHGNFTNMLNTDLEDNLITDADYEVMMQELINVSDSQHSPIPSEVTIDVNGSNVDGSTVHNFFNDYVYTVSPANCNATHSSPVPVLGFPLHMARNTSSTSDNSFTQWFTDTDPRSSKNVWFSNMLSTFSSRFTPNGVKYTGRFPAHTMCFGHNKTTISGTRAMVEQLTKIDVASKMADLTQEEKRLVSNYTLEKNRTTPDLTVTGVSFLNPIVDRQLGDNDLSAKMGLATADSQFTDREFYRQKEQTLQRYKYGHESQMLVDPNSVPLYEGGGEGIVPSSPSEWGANVYYIRGTWSSNRLVSSPMYA